LNAGSLSHGVLIEWLGLQICVKITNR